MTDLPSRIAAAIGEARVELDRDERLAKAAGGNDWTPDAGDLYMQVSPHHYVPVKPVGVEHIARNDPAFVLASVARSRALLTGLEKIAAWAVLLARDYDYDQSEGFYSRAALALVAEALGCSPEREQCDHPNLYYCPLSGDNECPRCGGFDTCCAEPQRHEEARIEGAS